MCSFRKLLCTTKIPIALILNSAFVYTSIFPRKQNIWKVVKSVEWKRKWKQHINIPFKFMGFRVTSFVLQALSVFISARNNVELINFQSFKTTSCSHQFWCCLILWSLFLLCFLFSSHLSLLFSFKGTHTRSFRQMDTNRWWNMGQGYCVRTQSSCSQSICTSTGVNNKWLGRWFRWHEVR